MCCREAERGVGGTHTRGRRTPRRSQRPGFRPKKTFSSAGGSRALLPSCGSSLTWRCCRSSTCFEGNRNCVLEKWAPARRLLPFAEWLCADWRVEAPAEGSSRRELCPCTLVYDTQKLSYAPKCCEIKMTKNQHVSQLPEK